MFDFYSLGSTRFMKVARVWHNGPMVMKIFVVVDQSFAIEPYRDQILQIRNKLFRYPNCCPFTKVYVEILLLFVQKNYLDDKQMCNALQTLSKVYAL